MPLVNVKKKVEKAKADNTGIRPDEAVLAGCTTNPAGTMKKMVAKELSGAVGAIAASRSGAQGAVPSGDGMAERFVSGQNFVVLTDQRLLLIKMSTMTGKPKELLAEWNHADVASITVEKGTFACPFTIMFSDGSGVQVEGAKGSDPHSVEEAYSHIT